MILNTTEVGVRELKARLSEHLRRAQAGERLVVTDRGKPIATLGPADDQPARPAWLVQLAAEGRVRIGHGVRPVGMHPRAALTSGATVSDAVIDDRR
jgi:prevent-host-death family protein